MCLFCILTNQYSFQSSKEREAGIDFYQSKIQTFMKTNNHNQNQINFRTQFERKKGFS